MAHAAYAIAGIVLAYGKTTKTACGKRVATSALVARDATDCADCQRAIEADARESETLRNAAEEILRAEGCPKCGKPFSDVVAWAAHDRAEH